MYSRWDLKDTVEGTSIHFHNLKEDLQMDCGFAEAGADSGALLAWMQDQQGYGCSVVFMNGEYIGMILPEVSDVSLPKLVQDVGVA
jgi:hypothetical protein